MTAATLVRSATLSRPELYFYVYWTAEPGALLLKLLAVYESFMKVFQSFYLLERFRLLLPGAITLALAVSVLRALSHPTEASKAASIVVAEAAAAMAAQYIVLAVSVLFIGLVMLLRLPWRVREYRMMLAFGISALGSFSEAALRFEFPNQFQTLSSMLASAAYTLALVVWVTAVGRRSTPKLEVVDQAVSPEHLVRELRRQLAVTRSMLGL